jgi:hypothetical protein
LGAGSGKQDHSEATWTVATVLRQAARMGVGRSMCMEKQRRANEGTMRDGHSQVETRPKPHLR